MSFTVRLPLVLLGLFSVVYLCGMVPVSAWTLGDALDNTDLAWTTGGDAHWIAASPAQSTSEFKGGIAAMSLDITDGQSAWLRTTVGGAGLVRFYWKVTSEGGRDYLRFFIDGTERGLISGETAGMREFTITGAGSHTLEWRYTKDPSGSSGQDAGWVDAVRFAPAGVILTTFQITPPPYYTGSELSVVSDSLGEIDSFEYCFGDGSENVTGAGNPGPTTHTYTAPGDYTITLTLRNAAGASTASQAVQIITIPAPTVRFSCQPNGIDGEIAVDDEVTFNIEEYSGYIASYEWAFGDGSPNVKGTDPFVPGSGFPHTFTAPGTYTVSLTVRNSCGASTFMEEVKVVLRAAQAGFRVSIPPDGLYYANEPVTFTSTSTGTITSVEWSFGDGTPNETGYCYNGEYGVGHTYTAAGIYPVTLTARNSCSADTETRDIIVLPARPPMYEFFALRYHEEYAYLPPGVGYAGEAIAFSASRILGDPTSHEWSYGDGTPNVTCDGSPFEEADANPMHTFTAPGLYTVTLTVRNIAGASSSTSAIDIITPPAPGSAAFHTEPTVIYANEASVFCSDAAGLITAYEWSFGDGTPNVTGTGKPDSMYPTPHTYTAPGAYAATLTVSNPGGSTAATRTITVAPDIRPPASVTDLTAISRNATAITWTWIDPTDADFAKVRVYKNGAAVGYLEKGVRTYTMTGLLPDKRYTLSTRTCDLAGNYNASFVNNTATTSALSVPAANFTADPTSGTAPLAVAFTDASTGEGIANRTWAFGDDGISTERNPVHTYTAAGNYTVNLTVANAAGANSTARTITVSAPRQANFTWTPAVPVAGGPVTFTDTSTGGPAWWEWSFGDGTTSTAQNPVHTYGSPGNYTVRLSAYYPGSEIGRDRTRAITVAPAVSVVRGGQGLPTDTNGDGLYDDVNGNGRKDFADVVLYFNQMGWIAANEPVPAFDYNSNSRIDFADVVWLFNHL